MTPPTGSVWRHADGRRVYVLFVGTDVATGRAVVGYRDLPEPYHYWVSPLREFTDGRFTRVESPHDPARVAG